MVAEGAPRHGGQELAKLLAKEGLHTTLIPDSAIFAMMARVNKVPTRAILCRGCHAGTLRIFSHLPHTMAGACDE